MAKLYVAYGSNLNKTQMMGRCPGAEFVGTGIIENYNVWNLEREMFIVLERAVTRFGLSYTECNFPKLNGCGPKEK